MKMARRQKKQKKLKKQKIIVVKSNNKYIEEKLNRLMSAFVLVKLILDGDLK